MDKNVSGVDLEELLKARQELDRERGVETDPDLYNNYQKQGNENEGLVNSQVDEPTQNTSVSDSDADTGGSQENLSKFGAFSAFEINEVSGDESSIVNVPIQNSAQSVEKTQEQSIDDDIDKQLEKIDNSEDLNGAINALIDEFELDEFELDEELEAERLEKNDKIEQNKEEMFAGRNFQTDIDVEPKLDSQLAEEIIPEKADVGSNAGENLQDAGIITNYNQLKEILQKELKESENAIIKKQEKPKQEQFVEIEDFKFINEIAKDEFKATDRFSYIMGKRENGATIFGNLKEHLNLAVFGKKDEIINSFLNSMILCICLKNSYNDVNFALLDSNIDSAFDVYNKSSYLYFNRIAKTNKEIRDTLIEISKEVDNRYDKLASVGVKTIEEYNSMATKNAFSAIPYIIVVFNNYTFASQATDNDKINACLYQILKFGRIAGIYCVVGAKLPIENSQVNYNLSSRISFKGDTDSRFTIGEAGSDALKEDNDALYFNISSGVVEHIKTAIVTDNELELIINDLEE